MPKPKGFIEREGEGRKEERELLKVVVRRKSALCMWRRVLWDQREEGKLPIVFTSLWNLT